MSRLRKLVSVLFLSGGAVLVGAAPVFASNVCPVIGGPGDPQIHATPAVVPDKSGNPAHGADPSNPQPGDAFWN